LETPEDSKPEAKESDGIQNKDSYYYYKRTLAWLGERANASSLTDWIIGVFTAVLTVVAILQCCLLGRQAKIMSADERGRIILKIEQVDKSGKKQVSLSPYLAVPVLMVNTGKTPVRTVIGTFNAEIVKNGEMPKFDLFKEYPDVQPTIVMGSLHPSDEIPSAIARATPEKTVKQGLSRQVDLVNTTPAELTDLNNGTSWVAFFGRVEYDDEFGTHHWTEVCGWYTPVVKTMAFRSLACVAANDEDTN
jgi:hypothetical protein